MNVQPIQSEHLSDLQLERLFAGESLDAALMAHFESCELCQARLEAIRSHEATYAPGATPKVTRSSWTPYGTVLAAAAAIILYVFVGQDTPTNQTQFMAMDPTDSKTSKTQDPLEGPDTFRIKGSLNAYFKVKRGDKAVILKSGDTVFPNDIVNFEVASPKAGYLMVLAIDGADKPYLCYPQNNEEAAMAFGPVQAMTELDAATRLDQVLGQEDLYTIFCPNPFDYDSVAQGVQRVRTGQTENLVLPNKDCQVRSVRVKKVEQSAP